VTVLSSPGADDRLRQIELLTDASLVRLGPAALVDELLDRAITALGADVGAMLLLDESADEFVVTEVRGKHAQLELPARIPSVGSFTARVAAARRPLALMDLRDVEASNHVLRAYGIRAAVGAPLVAADRVLGVLHVGRLLEQPFSDDEADLLQIVADRIALGIQNEKSREDRSAARSLQRSLLPTSLPKIPGLELAARYVPGEGGSIGGDWYDVFTLPSGRFCVVMGDVAGHGLAAAVVMGRLRSALRAYALEYDDPADVLERLDRKARHFEAGSMATVAYASFDPDLSEMRVSLAGHLPPVLALPGYAATVAELPVDPPVGVGAVVPRRTSTVRFPPGALLAFYTDGLVERRGVVIDVGLAALCQVIVDAPPDVLCTSVMASMLGQDAPLDDVALLAVRRPANSAG
jgi:hypothetical protein